MAKWLPLTVSLLVSSCTDAFKLPPVPRGNIAKRAPTDSQNLNNLLVTDAHQELLLAPTSFGDGSQEILSILDTYGGDIIFPSRLADKLTGMTPQGKSVTTGNITSGAVSIAGWSVPDQDIVIFDTPPPVTNDTGFQVAYLDRESPYAYFGLGTNNQSQVSAAFPDWSSETFITRVLGEYHENRYYTLLFQPSPSDYGTDETLGGVLTIGEIIDLIEIFFNGTKPDTADLDDVPDLSEVTHKPFLQFEGRAEIIIEGLTGPAGPVKLTSNYGGVPAGNTTAYIDSTQSAILVNPDVAEAIYSSVPGAMYDSDSRQWHIPCVELNATFTIAGYDYPMSPFSMMYPSDTDCIGTFQPKEDVSVGDIILGTAFLKNVYALFGYTTWMISNNNGGDVSDPYIQLMSLTNLSEAHDDWARYPWKPSDQSGSPSSSTPAGSQSTSTPTGSTVTSSPSGYSSTSIASGSTPVSSSLIASTPAPSPTASGLNSTSDLLSDSNISGALSDDDDDKVHLGKGIKDWLYHCLPAIIVGAIFVFLALIGLSIWLCLRRKAGPAGRGTYKTLDEGRVASTAHVPLYGAEEGHNRYTDPYKD